MNKKLANNCHIEKIRKVRSITWHSRLQSSWYYRIRIREIE